MENRIKNRSIGRAVLLFLSKKETRKTSLKLIWTILNKFFLPQFQSKFKIKKHKIVTIDHTLDKLIPFSSDYLKTYVGFTSLWIKSISFLYKEFGRKALPYIYQFIDGLEQLYMTAYSVYEVYQSTTARPKSGKNIPLKLVHMADPHLNCLPSLHVMIVSYTLIRINSFLDILAPGSDTYIKERKYLFFTAVRIIDSVLFLKQHSINCIPAGLFALRSAIKDFHEELPYQIAEKMLNTSRISRSSKKTIEHYMVELYKAFLEKSKYIDDTAVLIDFLQNYRQIG